MTTFWLQMQARVYQATWFDIKNLITSWFKRVRLVWATGVCVKVCVCGGWGDPPPDFALIKYIFSLFKKNRTFRGHCKTLLLKTSYAVYVQLRVWSRACHTSIVSVVGISGTHLQCRQEVKIQVVFLQRVLSQWVLLLSHLKFLCLQRFCL